MATAVIMPKAGMAMEEGTVVQWYKKEGDSIAKGEVILEIETDKVTMEVEAETSGILLKILAGEGEIVPVIQTIGWIGEKGEPVPDQFPDQAGSIAATPAAKRLAGEYNVDLSGVNPTGKHGEILSRDVEIAVAPVSASSAGEVSAASSRNSSSAAGSPSGSVSESAIMSSAAVSPLAAKQAGIKRINIQGIRGSGPGGRIMTGDLSVETRTPLAGIRKATARAMSSSHAEVVPVTLNSESDITLIMAVLRQNKVRRDEAPGLNDVLIRACALALLECPWMGSRLEGEEIVTPGEVHIGIAVAMTEGLMVPVIRHPDTLTLSDIHRITSDLISRTRDRKLLPDELSGAVFTVTNLGMFGITHFTPVVPLPQSAILGVGAAASRLKMENGSPEESLILPLSLTIDHRLIDGAQGALFLSALKGYLEDPFSLTG